MLENVHLPSVPNSVNTARGLDDHVYRQMVDSIGDFALFMLAPTGTILSWNPGAERIHGYVADEIVGWHFSRLYPQEAGTQNHADEALETAARTGRCEQKAICMRKNGQTFHADIVVTPFRHHDGEPQTYVTVVRDLTEQVRQDELLRQSEERFRLLVDGVRDYAIFMVDPDGNVMSWNKGAMRIKGYRPDEIIGRSLFCFYTPEDIAANKPFQLLETARLRGSAHDCGWRVRKDGSRFLADVTITALHDAQGILRGYAKVTRDLTQIKRIETLEQESRRINEFLAMLAHELRNPLAAIRNAVSLLEMGALNKQQLEWCRSVIDRQTSHLTQLVDELLDVSRITSGKVKLNREDLDLSSVINRGIETSLHLIHERRHHLTVTLPQYPIRVNGDMTRLTQVVANLLNNAAKYTPPGGRIDVSVRMESSYAGIVVSDNGIGIPKDLIGRIFDLFQQGTRTLDRKEGGLGVGLTLVETITMLHGGRVNVKSDGAGAGSEFIVWLPALPQTPEPLPLPLPLPLPKTASRLGAFTPRRVLIVDDNLDAAESMSMLMEAIGNEARTVHEGHSAAEVARRFKPDLVLLDIGLPGMNGYEVAKQFRSSKDLCHIRLIAVTGYGQDQDKKLAREAGFDDFLIKPVTLQQLTAVSTAAR